MKFELTHAAKEFLVEKGFDEKYGARPLKRAIQKYLEDEIAEIVLVENLGVGAVVTADYEAGADKLKFEFTKGVSQIDEKTLLKPTINTPIGGDVDTESDVNKN